MTATTAFTANGKPVSVAHDADETLLIVLRNRLDLTGSRYGCGLEQCGACVVLVDGEARPSCALPVEVVAGRAVTTVEALADDPVGKVLLRVFDEDQAGQCGYCLSGILVRALELIRHTPLPGRAEIVAALDPHLCRCGAHPRILAAIERASVLAAEAAV